MDKLFDAVLKAIPAEAIPVLLAITAAFFGVYYYKGLRNYADAINDKTFLAIGVVIAAIAVAYFIQKPEHASLREDVRPLLLVPDFEDDERRQFKTLFTQQLQAFLSKLNKEATITPISVYIRDRESARLTGKDYKAVAVLYQPKVIRLEDKKTVLCFNLLLLDLDANKVYPPISAQVESATLEEISSTLLGSLPSSAQEQNPIAARVDLLERKINQLSSDVLKLSALRGGPVDRSYPAKRALVIASEITDEQRIPPLRYARSDAEQMASALNQIGFETVIISGVDATRVHILDALEDVISRSGPDDLLLVYYTGTAVKSSTLRPDGSSDLVLGTFDLNLDRPLDSLTRDSLLRRLASANQVYRLVMINSCYAAAGISNLRLPPDGASNGKQRSFQVISGTQDDELGYELSSLDGGAFTYSILSNLREVAENGIGLSTNEMVSRITPVLMRITDGRQRPKLVTIAGTEDIILSSSR